MSIAILRSPRNPSLESLKHKVLSEEISSASTLVDVIILVSIFFFYVTEICSWPRLLKQNSQISYLVIKRKVFFNITLRYSENSEGILKKYLHGIGSLVCH